MCFMAVFDVQPPNILQTLMKTTIPDRTTSMLSTTNLFGTILVSVLALRYVANRLATGLTLRTVPTSLFDPKLLIMDVTTPLRRQHCESLEWYTHFCTHLPSPDLGANGSLGHSEHIS